MAESEPNATKPREKTSEFAFFATCAARTEVALREELRELGLYRVRADRGGARFVGDLVHGLDACLQSRIASRILLSLATFPAPDADALYQGVRDIEWERWVGPQQTLAVSAVSRDEALRHTNFVGQKTKDAIVDRIRDREGARPDVDRESPDVAVFVHIQRGEARIFLDLAGEPLHRRGWRQDVGPAPLKETLAAAILRLAEWDRRSPMCDPVCGSGTLAIEANLWARRVPPGLKRTFGAERWRSFGDDESRVLRELRERAAGQVLAEGPLCVGSDIEPLAIRAARANADRAESAVELRIESLAQFRRADGGSLIVGNPPYGVRLGERDFWRDLERALPAMRGARLALLLSEPPPEGILPTPRTVHSLFNGALDCGLGVWDLE